MNVSVLNQEFELVAVIDSYESLIWTDRYNAYGDFELCIAINRGELFPYLKEDNYLCIKESDHCMIIESIKTTTNTEEGNRLIVTGRSLESILERRIMWGQKTFGGALQNVVQLMLSDCIISPSLEARKIPNFLFIPSDDPKMTSIQIHHQYTGNNLYSVVKDLCEEHSIGFKITLTSDNKFAFTLYSGSDRSYDQTQNAYVVFSPNFENILSSNYLSSKVDFKNVTLVAGEGEGASRKTIAVGSASGLDRRELFTDARDISSDTESGVLSDTEYDKQLQSRGEQKLVDHAVITAFEGEVEATRLFTYGKDFFVGDVVQIVDEYGNEGTVYISEVVISNDNNGLAIYPTFQNVVRKEED